MLTGPQLDPHSDTWKFIRAWAEERLATTRTELESQTLDEKGLAAKQEKIRTLRALLLLAAPKPPAELPDEVDNASGGY